MPCDFPAQVDEDEEQVALLIGHALRLQCWPASKDGSDDGWQEEAPVGRILTSHGQACCKTHDLLASC